MKIAYLAVIIVTMYIIAYLNLAKKLRFDNEDYLVATKESYNVYST